MGRSTQLCAGLLLITLCCHGQEPAGMMTLLRRECPPAGGGLEGLECWFNNAEWGCPDGGTVMQHGAEVEKTSATRILNNTLVLVPANTLDTEVYTLVCTSPELQLSVTFHKKTESKAPHLVCTPKTYHLPTKKIVGLCKAQSSTTGFCDDPSKASLTAHGEAQKYDEDNKGWLVDYVKDAEYKATCDGQTEAQPLGVVWHAHTTEDGWVVDVSAQGELTAKQLHVTYNCFGTAFEEKEGTILPTKGYCLNWKFTPHECDDVTVDENLKFQESYPSLAYNSKWEHAVVASNCAEPGKFKIHTIWKAAKNSGYECSGFTTDTFKCKQLPVTTAPDAAATPPSAAPDAAAKPPSAAPAAATPPSAAPGAAATPPSAAPDAAATPPSAAPDAAATPPSNAPESKSQAPPTNAPESKSQAPPTDEPAPVPVNLKSATTDNSTNYLLIVMVCIAAAMAYMYRNELMQMINSSGGDNGSDPHMQQGNGGMRIIEAEPMDDEEMGAVPKEQTPELGPSAPETKPPIKKKGLKGIRAAKPPVPATKTRPLADREVGADLSDMSDDEEWGGDWGTKRD